MPVSAKWWSIAYGDDKFVAIAYDSDITAHSTDGITWTQAKPMPISAKWSSIAYADGKFIAVIGGSSGSDVAAYMLTENILEYKLLESGVILSADGCESRKLIIKDNKIMFEDETNFTVRDDGAGNLTISGMTVIDSNGNVTIGG